MYDEISIHLGLKDMCYNSPLNMLTCSHQQSYIKLTYSLRVYT